MMRTLLIVAALGVASVAMAATPQGVRQALHAAVEAQVADPAATIHIRDIRSSDEQALAAASRFSLALLPGEKPYGQVTARATLGRGADAQAVFVMARVEVSVPVWVVARRVSRGAHVGEDELAVESRPIDRLPSGALRADMAPPGTVASRTLTPGQVLTRRALTTPVLVRRGAHVTVIAETGGVRVSTRGEALRAGRLGDRVNVRLESRRIVSAAVTASNRVVLR